LRPGALVDAQRGDRDAGGCLREVAEGPDEGDLVPEHVCLRRGSLQEQSLQLLPHAQGGRRDGDRRARPRQAPGVRANGRAAARVAVGFAAFGFGLVVVLRWWGGWHPILDGQPLVLVSALVAAPLGFLAGIGTFDYWTYYALGHPTRPEDHSGHGARSWRDYFRVNTDHKVIGVQYLVTTVIFCLIGGLLATVM